MAETRERTTGRPVPYTDAELFAYGPIPPYEGKHLNEIAFPLGGVGTGCVSLSGRGQLLDWEIFNRPNKGYRPAHSYFTLFCREDGGEPVFRVLEGRIPPPYQENCRIRDDYSGYGFGPSRDYGSGFLRFEQCRFISAFPFAEIDLADPTVPVTARIEAWSPFIPLDEENSSLPIAVFDITLTNTSTSPVRATVALGLENVLGWPEVGRCRNEWWKGEFGHGVRMTTEKHEPDSARYGELLLVTPDDDVTYELRHSRTEWFGATESLLDEFGATGEFAGPTRPLTSPENETQTAHLGLKVRLAPGESATGTLMLVWLIPNFQLYWMGDGSATWPTYQAERWLTAEAIAEYALVNLATLRARSRAFAGALLSSTLPTYVLDAISTQASILRTPTVTRLTDGTLYGFEGCHGNAGCCPGSCTHVWGYAQTMAHLFPALERGMREAEFAHSLRASDGHMQFRIPLPPGTEADHCYHAAVDGQMACVLRTYREWQLCGDDAWLEALWPSVKKTLEYAWVAWDADRDGVLEGVHHNTLDIEYHGPETACGSMYLAALRAAEEMGRRLGDTEAAEAYRRVFESGSRLSDERLYNGEYYIQALPLGCKAPYQFGPGCHIDQVLGQWHARMLGLGNLYDPRRIRSALTSVYRYNFRDDFFSHHNPHRVYAMNEDKGMVICTWPNGGRPKVSVTYAFECMIGFEYQAGSHLVYEGYLKEGLTVCKAVRDRHNGWNRNPFNEFECGSHYARSLANYAYLLALSGFRYSAVDKTLWLNPFVHAEDFRCFFSVPGAWGLLHLVGDQLTVHVHEGHLALEKLVLRGEETTPTTNLVMGGEPVRVTG